MNFARLPQSAASVTYLYLCIVSAVSPTIGAADSAIRYPHKFFAVVFLVVMSGQIPAEVLATLNTVDDALAHAGVRGEATPTSFKSRFAAVLGFPLETPLMVLGAVPPDEYLAK